MRGGCGLPPPPQMRMNWRNQRWSCSYDAWLNLNLTKLCHCTWGLNPLLPHQGLTHPHLYQIPNDSSLRTYTCIYFDIQASVRPDREHLKIQRLITSNFCKYRVSELQNGCDFLQGDMSCPVQELRTPVLTISWFIFNRHILHLSCACIILNSVWHIHTNIHTYMGTCESWALYSTFIMYCNIFSPTTKATSS